MHVPATWRKLVLSKDVLMQLKAFVCDIYGIKNGISDVNKCRYSVFRAKKGNNNNNNNNSINNNDDDDDNKLYLSVI